MSLSSVPFHTLGKPRHLDPAYHDAKQRAAWTWVQPKNRDELLSRLADARDRAVPERERENLCSVAHGEITRLIQALQDLVDDSYSLIEQPSRIRPATGLGVYRCLQCEAIKGDKTRQHAPGCQVGFAEHLLGVPPLMIARIGDQPLNPNGSRTVTLTAEVIDDLDD